MNSFFVGIYNLIRNNRLKSLSLLIVIIVLCGILASKISLSEDITKILPDNKKLNHVNFVYSNSKLLDKIVFSISLNDTSQVNAKLLSEFADNLTDSIYSRYVPNLIKTIDYAPSQDEMMEVYDLLSSNLPIFLSDSDYDIIDTIINPLNVSKTIRSNYTNLIGPVSFATKAMISADPLHLTPIVLNKLKTVNSDDNFLTYGKYFITKDKRNIIFLLTPASSNKTAENEVLFYNIDMTIGTLNQKFNNQFNVDYFGNALVALGNARQIKSDIIITVSIAIILLIIVITFFFRSKRAFIIIFMPAIFGAIVSLAVLYLIKGEVSAISLGIGAVLLGICIDYSLHIYSHFREGVSKTTILNNLSGSIILSSLTTASAFLSLYFVNSAALNDLGLFAAISIISAAIFSLVVMPHLLGKSKDKRKSNLSIIDTIAKYDYSRGKYLKYIIVIITIILFITSSNVGFDADMMKNNYMSDQLAETEKRINAITSLSKKTIYIVTTGKDSQKALERNAEVGKIIYELEADGLIKGASVINKIFPSQNDQNNAIDKWNNYWVNKSQNLKIIIDSCATKSGFRENAFDDFFELLKKDYHTITIEDSKIIYDLFIENFLIEKDSLCAIINIIKVNNLNTDINAVYNQFDDMDHVWIIDKRLITSEFVTILNNNFNKLVTISLSLVFLILLIAYGRIELAIITMIPIIVSWIWTVGIMGILGIDFNIFNVIILTFIFGLGIDYSIFIMRGLLLEFKTGKEELTHYKVSIILSGITTIAGVGVLIFAQHPALRSIAIMSIIGIMSVIIVTFSLLPIIFRWLVYNKNGKRNRPITFIDLIFSIWALLVFVSGSIILSLITILFEFVPIKRSKKKVLLHKVFRYLTWLMIYMNFMSKKTIINTTGEDYIKPSIIIANHQSHVDVMLMMLLNWRVVALTNPRNFSSPIYGRALRYAGFIEVDGDFDYMLEQVKKQTDEGYSVVIFPEGHRSEGNKLKRFHKGAFQLASELDLEILPIIIYGQKEALKKSEFFLKRAEIVTKFLPRIRVNEHAFGVTPRDQAKNIKKYFENEYHEVARYLETPNYFSNFIKNNFIYKGPVLEWYTKIKINLEDDYKLFNDLIPNTSVVSDLGCGYGYLSLLLGLMSNDRVITGVDYDYNKIATAKNCAVKSDNVTFISADITNLVLNKSDVFILNDVLHYLPTDKQELIIDSCISSLNENGMIIIRDADKDMTSRHIGTIVTEFFSTRLGFNKYDNKLEFTSKLKIEKIVTHRNMKMDVIDNTKRTSNIIYIIKSQKN